MPKDFYKILGINKNASQDEIKKSYKKLALKYHPDRNKEEDAELRFKEITEAYETLSDKTKRAHYDAFGSKAQHNSDIFSHFHNNFGDIFGDFFRKQPNNPQQKKQNTNLIKINCNLTLRDCYTGCKKDILVNIPETCSVCIGTGAEPNTNPILCEQCNGKGNISINKGFILFTQTCGACRGAGKIITTCNKCIGQRYTLSERTLNVKFPPGIKTGQNLRLNYKNNFVRGIIISVIIEESNTYTRVGDDMIVYETINFAEAVLGTERKIILPDLSTIDVKIPAGIQFGAGVIVSEKGFFNNEKNKTGNLIVKINIPVPKNQTEECLNLIKKLKDMLI
jgi:molecular chaperone DnaJ